MISVTAYERVVVLGVITGIPMVKFSPCFHKIEPALPLSYAPRGMLVQGIRLYPRPIRGTLAKKGKERMDYE